MPKITTRQILFSLLFLSALVLAVPTVLKHQPHEPVTDLPPPTNNHEHPRAAQTIGYVSIAFWVIVVYSPQLYLTYVEQSGEGLSLGFLSIWLAGDLTNLFGAYLQNLLTTMIILGAYYALCDIILIGQIFYYRKKRVMYPELYLPSTPSLTVPHESDPLISSFSASGSPNHPYDEKVKIHKDTLAFLGAGTLIVVVGVLAWFLSKGALPSRNENWNTQAQVFGWISAVLYLGSRIPQIAKNVETKCKGLSLLMFAFSIAGNVTYVASILLQSLSMDHLLINASWLIGSGGTIGLDFIVLSQFWYYAKARKEESAEIFSRVDQIRTDEDEDN